MIKNNPLWEKMTSNKKAAIAEVAACQWLLLQGYDVYKNISGWGAADIVAVMVNRVLLIDVCISSSKNDIKASCAKNRQREGIDIKFLYVMPDGSCKWRDDLFPMEKRICPACGQQFEIKAKTSRLRCAHCHQYSIPIR